jgi:predicted RNase H-like HicB family nuclease
VVDQLVELERVDLAGVVPLESSADPLEELCRLSLVVGADAFACGAALGLGRAMRIAGRWRAGGPDSSGADPADHGIVSPVSEFSFNAVFEDAGDGWVYAHVAELPEVHTQGNDLEEARAMVRDAIGLVLEDRRARGEPIPEQSWALVESVVIAA